MLEKVSIIVPVYNGEHFLNKCVDSVLNQNYKNIEMILVDDGSTDRSGVICDEYEKEYPDIKVILKKNGGQTSARKAGVRLASAEWVTFLDCDDWIEKDYIEKMINIIKISQDTDIVITSTELLRMIDNFGLDFATLEPEACDMPFGFGSGGGVIFGVTGGVTEAVLRRLTPDHSKETMHEIAECGVRGDEGIKEFTVPYEGMNLNICVASGLANARTVMEQVKNGEKEYHLIEIMACRRGCIMGGGQPTRSGDRTKALRAKGLYNADNTTIIKKSDENPLVLELYNGLLKGKEHHLLHNDSY